MDLPLSFISATREYADYDRLVPAPYIRKSFFLKKKPEKAEVTVSALGFYRIFIDGAEITKGILAPYISNPDDKVYYDRYDLKDYLTEGEHVAGLILGNGMQNAFGGYIWKFDRARWRGAPAAALRITAVYGDGEEFTLESGEDFKTCDSPLLSDDLRNGEYYDARLEIDGWNKPGFDDSDWKNALLITPPRGEPRVCEAEPIVVSESLKAVSITPCGDGYIYDFGVNAAGRARLKIKGVRGREIITAHREWYHDGILEQRNISFDCESDPRALCVQRNRYICRGGGVEEYVPWFSYYGFRYVYIEGIDAEQAVPELLTYEIMHSDLKEVGSFRCSDETANKIQRLTRRSTLSNFFYFPTDCPHREKNGWTGDAALSSEHTLLNLKAENSYREWLRNIRAAQDERGALPGIVPTGGWGFDWGNGPAWDCVLTYLPYFVWRYRGDIEIVEENATAIFRYLHYLTTRTDERGLIDIGLGDWCPVDRVSDDYKSPTVFTDSVISKDIADKAAKMFGSLGWDRQKEFAEKLSETLRAAVRKNLIDFSTSTAAGACQTSQAMAIYYNIFADSEKPAAFARLLDFIENAGGSFDCGILGLRVLFHVLSDFGRAELAYDMITKPEFPSYGNWIARGATSLWESFISDESKLFSMNHHFFGDVSGWFIQSLVGIRVNPDASDVNRLDIAPHFVKKLKYAEARHTVPAGVVYVRWELDGDRATARVEVPAETRGNILAPKGWTFENGKSFAALESGEYGFCRVKN